MINWQQFGLRKDPYDTLPLVEGGDLKIDQAFVGREREKKFLDDLFKAHNNLCLAICGEVGVGKTSLANFQKYLWKHHQRDKPLFSFRREIEASEYILNKQNFLIEIMGSVLREIMLIAPDLMKDEFLSKLNHIVDVTQTANISGGFSILGSGVDFGSGKSLNVPNTIPVTVLESYFSRLLNFIKTTEIGGKLYCGLVVHVNNFDVVLAEDATRSKAIRFFNEIRDILQITDIYYIFLGPRNLWQLISTQQRVKGIFVQTPLLVNALSKQEICSALQERLDLLKSEAVQKIIKPVGDEVIFHLYDLYEGDIRSILSAIKDLLNQYADMVPKTLSLDESMLLLGTERWNRIENAIKLTTEQKEILKHFAIKNEDSFSPKEIATLFKKAESNVYGYYLKPLKDNNIIEEKGKKGRTSYWGLTPQYLPIKFLLKSTQKVKEKVLNDAPSLFDLIA